MKRRMVCFVLFSLLFSCSGKKESENQRKVSSSVPTVRESLISAMKEECLNHYFSSSSYLISPIGSMLIDFYQNDDDSFLELYNALNVKTDHMMLRDTFATATSSTDKDTHKFKDKVTTFEGTKEELNQELKDFYDIDFDIVNENRLIYCSSLVLKDSFKVACDTEENVPFNGIGSYRYVHYQKQGKYYEDDDYTMVELALAETTFRVLMPKEGGAVFQDKIFDTELKSGLIDVMIPEFEMKKDRSTGTPGGQLNLMLNSFRFDGEGISGKAFEYTKPSSKRKSNSVAFHCTFDRPFLFMALAGDMPVFYGEVYSL